MVLRWQDSTQASFPRRWLRDHCACPSCRHPQTYERLVLPSVPFELEEAEIQAGSLRLTWVDGHRSDFDPVWLFQRRPGMVFPPQEPKARPWRSPHRPARISHRDFFTNPEALGSWLRLLLEEGIALLTDGPSLQGELHRVAQSLGPMRATNFGTHFDVHLHPDPNNAAYTAIGLALHTDLPNWRTPPDFQLLYCVENSVQGGSSIFSDGFEVAEALRQEAPEAFEILARTPIDFRFQDPEHDIAFRAPTLDVSPDGAFREIRVNNWIRDSLRLPEAEIGPWYRAYQRLWDLLQDPRHQIEFALKPGEMVIFDNRRVLHGRRPFDPQSGKRFLQGTYLDRDVLVSRLRVLGRTPEPLHSDSASKG